MAKSVTVESMGLPFATSIRTGRHEVLADEPSDLGGRDAGPTPVELFLGSIGACAAITARMYADRKGWPLEGVRATVTQERVESPGAGEAPTKITLTLDFTGPLSPEQRERILQIAGRCPVKRSIEQGIDFVTQAG
ncbi:MAG: hypothetical protein Kow00109_01000 [Acidobacteriota bacterium]